MARSKDKNIHPQRHQIKSIDPKEDPETNSEFYGDDRNRSTQIITNFFFNPKDFI